MFNRLFALVLTLGLTTFSNPAIADMVQRASPTPRYDQSNTLGYDTGYYRGHANLTVYTSLGYIRLWDTGTAVARNEKTDEVIDGYFTEYNECNYEVTLKEYIVYVTKPSCYDYIYR